MQRCIRDADGGRWIDSHDGNMVPLPGHGDPSLEKHRDLLEAYRDRNVVDVIEEDGVSDIRLGSYSAFKRVPVSRHRFAMRVRHGGWIWVVWQAGGARLLADSKSEWMDDMPTLGPPPEFALARFVHAPYPKGRP